MMADSAVRIRLAMLQEIADLGAEAAGDVWPTQEMALSRLFERGAAFLERGAILTPISGSVSAEIVDPLNVCREDLLLVEALHLVTRHVAFVLTTEGMEREALWLSLAD